MPSFSYSAKDRSGSATQGSIEASSRRDVVRRLQARGLTPVRISETGGDAPRRKDKTSRRRARTEAQSEVSSKSSVGKKVSSGEFTSKLRLPFLESLSDLIQSGMSAGEAIRLLAMRLSDPKLKALYAEIWAKLGEGVSLSNSLSSYPAVFDGQTINLIAAGEATGNLQEVLDRLISHFTNQKELRSKLASSLAYPMFICCMAIGVILFFLLFLLPKLQTLLSSLGGKLPRSTQLLVNVSEFTLHYGLFAGIGFVLLVISLWSWRRTAHGRLASDEMLTRAPLLKGLVIRTTVLNFCQTLSVLLENGITTADALRLSERTVKNEALKERLHDSTDRVLEGESMSNALSRTGIFPPLLLDRLSVSEQTGNLAPGLRDIARSYRTELDRWLTTFSKTISGAVLVVAFSFVAFIAWAIVSAVFQVSSSFRF